MSQSLKDSTVLSNGVKMPWLGLGVWRVKEGQEIEDSVKHAISTGYVSIDTAAIYGNEEGVGRAIHNSGAARDKLFVTTKVWNADQGYDTTLKAFEESRRKLGLDYLDLYLIHWPVKGKYKDTWRALEKLYKDGLVRSIGVSNFHVHHLEDLLDGSDVKPMVNQVEYHPLLTQKPLLAFCKDHNIQLEAWSPLMQGNLDLPLLAELSEKYKKSPAQIVIRWDIQHGVVTIPKSVTAHRIEENANVFDFILSQEDMDRLDGLNQDKRFGPDPDHINF
ncbi:aldo/keto reductase [Paenibacillus sp. GCM10012307]|uniref:Aldo/keto reductase n=1 Tax=Paenibacillus roseus TaxID=2798579 RepID=A0A934J2H9_9BACL|nr:aldo/keto reductase [Paenibacillus roseus]MBJ6360379.1 aldo/keto reductase [Paenibacillus roseus]